MDTERWHQIDQLFHAIVGQGPSEREVMLRQIGARDEDLRREVESLVRASQRPSSFIDATAFEISTPHKSPGKPDPLPGHAIGHFRINRLIGAGGMGSVYEAEQESPRRAVAIKLRRALPFQDELTARLFLREGQALARLQHPGIAAIYEAGQTDDGWHYFAMERVHGAPLTQYVREHAISMHDRLVLFKLICDAVHYAHQRGVIHRDLKPSNILITDDGMPKILDFGLARMIDTEGELSQLTEPGAFLGTLAYTSPEQARGQSADIDVRSDVYSLGIVLYEMLTDRLPYETSGMTLAVASRVICEKNPHRAGSIRRELRGDLETIVQKAIEKEPKRRYDSAAALADDIDRHLKQQPIVAHPPSASYQFRKFARRHRGAVASMISIVLLLVGSSVWLSILYSRALQSEKRAQAEAAQAEMKARTAQRVIDFLKGMFGPDDPHWPTTPAMTVEDLLNRDVKRVYAELGDQPEVQGDLLEVLAMVFQDRGNAERGAELHEAGWKCREKVFGEHAPEIAASMANLGNALCDLDRFTEAEKHCRRAFEIFRLNYGMENYFTATALSSLSRAISERDPAAAEPICREVLSIFRRLNKEHDGPVTRSKQYLAETLDRLGNFTESEQLLRDVISDLRATSKMEEPRFVHVQNDLASVLMHQQRFDEARAASQMAKETCTKVFGAGPSLLQAEVLCMQGAVEEAAGDFQQARSIYENAVSTARAAHHAPHLDLANALSGLARSLVRAGTSSGAVPLFEESLAIRRELLNPPDPRLAAGLRELADGLRAVGRTVEADELSREATQSFANAASSDLPG